MDEQAQSQAADSGVDLPLVALFRHNLWANLSLLDACAALDDQQLAATAEGTYGDIYSTLTHILRAEQSYLRRLTGQQPDNPLQGSDRPDVAALRTYALQSGDGLMKAAAEVAESDVLDVEGDGYRWTVPTSLILTQAINHSTEHRSQIMTIMTQQGVEPPSLSGWAYMEASITPTPVEG